MKVKFRTATPLDAAAIYRATEPMIAEGLIAIPDPQPAATMHWIVSLIEQGFIVLAEAEDGTIGGSIALKPARYPWAPDFWFVENAWFYVAPRFRKGGTAIRLLEKAKEISDQKKIPFMLSIMSGVHPELKDRLCRLMGFTYAGGIFAYNFGRQ